MNGTAPEERVPPFPPDGAGLVNVFVECERGADVKHKFDPCTGALAFHKRMPAGHRWPFAYGFVCGTRAQDGDPIDAVVLSGAQLRAGGILPVRPVGLIEAIQTVGSDTHRNDRVLAVDPACPVFGAVRSVEALPAGAADSVARFFVEYNAAQGRGFSVLGVQSAAGARAAIVAGTPNNPARGGHADDQGRAR